MATSFNQAITERNRVQGLRLCVGLDTNGGYAHGIIHASAVEDSVVQFNRELIQATARVACVYKPNLWFYLVQERGVRALRRTVEAIQNLGIPALVDSKFGDIGSTSEEAASFLFNTLDADATTANVYLGQDAMQPVLDWGQRGVIGICKTSNPGSAEIQDRRINILEEQDLRELACGPARDTNLSVLHKLTGLRAWQLVALRVANHWNTNGNCGLVVGATYPEELAVCRQIVGPDLPILIPGVGKQGGDLEAAVRAGVGEDGQGVIMLNVSSGIGKASGGKDFAEAAGRAADELNQQILAAVPKAA